MVLPLLLAAATCGVPLDLPPPPAGRPRYVLSLRIQAGLKQVEGSLVLSFAPEVATDRLVFRLWPNSPVQARAGAKLSVTGIRVNDEPVTPLQRDPTTLVIPRTIAAGERITAAMRWTLRLPRVATTTRIASPSRRTCSTPWRRTSPAPSAS
jgi:hypothetical protein